ncbi:hypothetical protein JXD38_00410 [candidate division WOR-3 bacterium]|nr:hypothetical protein [candidate division WOR-3 bacterium]
MRIFAGLCALFVLSLAISMPEAGSTPPEAVPFAAARKVALNMAASEFPGAKLGTAIPYVDEDGNTVAWMFHFRTDGKRFPGYDQVAADVQAERQTLTVNTDISRWRSKYAHILVSARRDRAPIIRFGYGTSEYYAIAAKAQARAEKTLGSDVRLSRVYFVSPSTYLEFTDKAGRSTVMSEHFERTWDSRAAFTGYVTDVRAQLREQCPGEEEAAAKYENSRWDHVFDPKTASLSEAFVPNHELAPFYDWSYGCTPTSGAMVCGYVDRFQKSGRLVQWFFQRFDDVEGETDWQIPYVQRECAIEMHTDTSYGGTNFFNISNGLFQVGYSHGYTAWSVTNTTGYSGNDWAWSTITSQVNAGHAMIWSAGWESHSLACFGYRTGDKYVYVHNTWWAPGEWWAHSGGGQSHVAAVTPDAGDVHNLRLTYPLGDTLYNHTGSGEVLYVGDTVRITWESGTPATTVDIDISTDGGHNWESAAAGVADSGAFHWYIPPSIPTCDSVRLRLFQYNGSTLTSADGTIGCFHTLREPLPPPQIAPPNGLPIQSDDLPVVLVVDSAKAACDSIHFKLVQGVDTLAEQKGALAHFLLPDSMFLYNKIYKWIVRGYNQWGWGSWSTAWSFRVIQSGIEDANPVPAAPAFSVPAVSRLASGGVQFDVRAAAPGSRMVVYDALGNVVRELAVAQPGRLAWDTKDETGKKVAAGFYFVRLAGSESRPTSKLVLLD